MTVPRAILSTCHDTYATVDVMTRLMKILAAGATTAAIAMVPTSASGSITAQPTQTTISLSQVRDNDVLVRITWPGRDGCPDRKPWPPAEAGAGPWPVRNIFGPFEHRYSGRTAYRITVPTGPASWHSTTSQVMCDARVTVLR